MPTISARLDSHAVGIPLLLAGSLGVLANAKRDFALHKSLDAR